jgi:hypothetical protein
MGKKQGNKRYYNSTDSPQPFFVHRDKLKVANGKADGSKYACDNRDAIKYEGTLDIVTESNPQHPNTIFSPLQTSTVMDPKHRGNCHIRLSFCSRDLLRL